jgi:hypothetical protein
MICRYCEKPLCTICGKCKRCHGCSCIPCEKCHNIYRPTKKYCRCRQCRKCCDCRMSPGYATDTRLGVSIRESHILSRLPRTIGIELEIADWKGLPEHIPGVSYTSAHDWSVRPSEREMVVSPLRGDGIIRGMLAISEACTSVGCVVNDSCALHVHVGAKDLSMWEIRRLLEVYRRIEEEIYSHLISPHRSTLPSIHYCQMMTVPHASRDCDRCIRYDRQYPGQHNPPERIDVTLERMWRARTTGDLKVCLYRMLYGMENPRNYPDILQTHKGGRYEWCRYFGLNLHSWTHRMTVEWRMKEATYSPTELIGWPLWCGWVVHAITKMSDADARSDKMSVRYLTDRYMPKYLMEYIERHGL